MTFKQRIANLLVALEDTRTDKMQVYKTLMAISEEADALLAKTPREEILEKEIEKSKDTILALEEKLSHCNATCHRMIVEINRLRDAKSPQIRAYNEIRNYASDVIKERIKLGL